MPVVRDPKDWRRHGKEIAGLLERWATSGRAVEQAVERVGVEYQEIATRILSQPGRGRVYRRGGVVHQASAPGDPPAVDRGMLRASVMWRTGRDRKGPWVEVGSPAKVAVWMEFGTRTIAARPWHEPSMRELVGRIRGIVETELGKDRP